MAERLRQKVATAELALEQGNPAHQALLEAKRTGRDKVCVAESAGRE